LLAAVKNAICGTPLGLVIDGSVACCPLMGRPSCLFAGADDKHHRRIRVTGG
jgi:hypothetical protein